MYVSSVALEEEQRKQSKPASGARSREPVRNEYPNNNDIKYMNDNNNNNNDNNNHTNDNNDNDNDNDNEHNNDDIKT